VVKVFNPRILLEKRVFGDLVLKRHL